MATVPLKRPLSAQGDNLQLVNTPIETLQPFPAELATVASPTNTSLTIQHRLPKLRRAAGMSAQQLADKAGLTQNIIMNMESRRTRVSVDELIALATGLGVLATDLVPELIPVSVRIADLAALQERLDSIGRLATGAVSA